MSAIARWALSSTRLIITGRWSDLLYQSRKVWWSRKLMARGVDLDYVSNEKLGTSQQVSAPHGVTPGFELERVLRALNVPSGSSIIDMGCGKGVSLFTFAKFPQFSHVAGCDISSDLLAIAEKNFLRLGLKGITLYCCDAATFTDFDRFDYVYLFNPFYGETFSRMVENLSKSLIRSPRPLTIIYFRPSCHEMVMASGDFVKEQEFTGGEQSYFIYCHRPK